MGNYFYEKNLIDTVSIVSMVLDYADSWIDISFFVRNPEFISFLVHLMRINMEAPKGVSS